MKRFLLFLAILLAAVHCPAPTYNNQFTTNPPSVLDNNINVGAISGNGGATIPINGAGVAVGGALSAASGTFGNLSGNANAGGITNLITSPPAGQTNAVGEGPDGKPVVLTTGGSGGGTTIINNFTITNQVNGASPVFSGGFSNQVIASSILANFPINGTSQVGPGPNTNGIPIGFNTLTNFTVLCNNPGAGTNVTFTVYTNVIGVGIPVSSGYTLTILGSGTSGQQLVTATGSFTGVAAGEIASIGVLNNGSSLSIPSISATWSISTVVPTSIASVAVTVTNPVSFATNAGALGGIPAQMVLPALSDNAATNSALAYGAIPNCYIYNNIGITNTTLECPNGNFNSTMVGNTVVINHAGVNGRWFFATVASVQSSLALTISPAVTLGVTNMSYMLMWNPATAQSNAVAFQNGMNAASNLQGITLYIPPPGQIAQMGVSNLAALYNKPWWDTYGFGTNLGVAYAISGLPGLPGGGPFQNTNQNNAILMAPPLEANSVRSPNSRFSINLVGSDFFQWGAGANGGSFASYLSIPSNSTALVVGDPPNNFVGTNGIGPSFLDCGRDFITPNGLSFDSYVGKNNVPCGSVKFRIKNLGILCSFDPGMAILNFVGSADGSGADNFTITGGNSPDSYWMNLGQIPSNTNSIGIIGLGNNNGQFAPFHYGCINGMYIGVLGCMFHSDDAGFTIGSCSNAIGIGYSSAIDFEIPNLQIGQGCVNLISSQPYDTAGNAAPGVFHVHITTACFNNGYSAVGPLAQEHILNDQSFSASGNVQDMFAGTEGTLIVNTNVNSGSGHPAGNYLWSGHNLVVYQEVNIPGAVGQVAMLYGNASFPSATITNLTVDGSGNGSSGLLLQNGAGATITRAGQQAIDYTGTSAEMDGNSPFDGFYSGLGLAGSGGQTPAYTGLTPPQAGTANMPIVYGSAVKFNQFTFMSATNGEFQAPYFKIGGATNYQENLNGIFSINAITNGASGTNFWICPSNQSLVIVKYSRGVVNFSVLMP